MTENESGTLTPPGTSIQPSSPCRQAMARPFWMALECMQPGPRPIIMPTGPPVPIMRAAVRTSSASIWQTSATFSGVHSSTRSTSFSKP